MSLTFIKTEVGARIGAVTTGGTTAVAIIEQFSPYIRFASLIIGALVGVATLLYYVPMAIERWLALIDKWRSRK